MSPDDDRAFHLERAAQCRSMAELATDAVVRKLHEQLAEFHEAEARRQPIELTVEQDQA